MQISWQAQRFGSARCRFSGTRSTFPRYGTDFVAGTVLSQGQVQISRQAQHFRKARYRFRGRRSTFARYGTDFVAGTVLSRGQVQISRQAQHFRKARYRFRGRRSKVRYSFHDRRSTFARFGAEFDAGAAFSQAVKKNTSLRAIPTLHTHKLTTFWTSSKTILARCSGGILAGYWRDPLAKTGEPLRLDTGRLLGRIHRQGILSGILGGIHWRAALAGYWVGAW